MRLIENEELRREILDAYFEYFRAYSERDWPKMTARFAKDMTMIGTGIDELTLDGQTTRELFKREFTQAPTPMTYNIKQMEVFSLAPEAALIVILMDMTFQTPETPVLSENNRTTAIMIKEGGSWKIAHGHWSQPDADQDVGESVPNRLLQEKNRRLEELVARRTEELRKSNSELAEALAKVKTLKGILPICAHCKNVRHDAGYWTQIEHYISEYTDTFFSHSICPECLDKHYSDLQNDSVQDPEK